MCAAAAGPSDVFVLDFDGVLVDSEPEVRCSKQQQVVDIVLYCTDMQCVAVWLAVSPKQQLL
jgi:phosphoglycolate phosphatase-like HAD superfamily hydrolase